MRLRFFVFVLSSVLPGLMLVSCAIKDSDKTGMIKLSGSWKIIEADNRDIAEPDYDDSGEEEIIIPGDWNHILEKNDDYAAIIWLRKRVFIGKEHEGMPLVLSMGKVALDDETYFNGHFVGNRGKMPADKDISSQGFAWQYPRNYFIPDSIIKYGRENVVCIRIFSQVISGIKDEPVLLTYGLWNRSQRFLKEYLPESVKIIPYVITFILMLFLFLIIKGHKNVRLILKGLALIIIANVIHLLLLGFPQMPTVIRLKLIFGLYMTADFVFLLLVREFFNVPFRLGTIICLVLVVAGEALLLFIKKNLIFMNYGLPLSAILLTTFILCAMGIFTYALFRDPRRYWYFSLIAVPILISFFLNSYYIITYQFYRMPISQLYHIPFFFMGAMFFYIIDLKNAKNDRDIIARKLLQKSQRLDKVLKELDGKEYKPLPSEAIYILIEYLDENYFETYDRRELAKKFGLNEDYMGQIFKKITGSNISTYVNEKRIEAAKQLIMETDTKIIDIAFHVGFDNLTYFYRLFKNKTGLAPNEFRKIIENGDHQSDESADEDGSENI